MTPNLRSVEEVAEEIVGLSECYEGLYAVTFGKIKADRAHIATVLIARLEGKRTKFVPADNEWVGDEDYIKGEYVLVPAKDPNKAMYCLTCERFLPEEGCTCGLISIDEVHALIRQTLTDVTSEEK
jgi:hypothetical protein